MSNKLKAYCTHTHTLNSFDMFLLEQTCLCRQREAANAEQHQRSQTATDPDVAPTSYMSYSVFLVLRNCLTEFRVLSICTLYVHFCLCLFKISTEWEFLVQETRLHWLYSS